MYHCIFSGVDVFKSCLCFDPSAPVDSRNRISLIADMNYSRHLHPLIVANGKLYAMGGWAEILYIFIRNICQLRFQGKDLTNYCNSIEEYDPQTNKWGEVGKLNFDLNPDKAIAYRATTIADPLEAWR